MNVLGIETSCDETSAAVLDNGDVRSSIISSHLVHKQYGGVVPELASRAHQKLIVPVVKEALDVAGLSHRELHAIAVTSGPGLMGALLVGLNFAKGMSLGLNIPIIGVNHLEGHIYSNFLSKTTPEFPFLCLIVSGGHTEIVLIEKPLKHVLIGETLDDAAGEAYDKVAKMLGLGFPGGPAIDRFAVKGNPEYVRFPRSMLHENGFDFSFSGVKTAVMYWLRDGGYYGDSSSKSLDEKTLSDLCASFQAAIVDVLVAKTLAASERYGIRDIAIAGGVSANSELRSRFTKRAREMDKRIFIPHYEYCTDNAAMIAMAGYYRLKENQFSSLDLTATANLSL
jgi:N6-L-threonylcarbamoyladenine synthase